MKDDPDFKDPESDDSLWEPFFEQRRLGSDAFARGVVAAVREDRRRRRWIRSGWSAAAAAVMLSAILWFGVLPNGPSGGAYASEVAPEDAAIYGELMEWELMLSDAEALVEEENRQTLELLFALYNDAEE